MSKQPATYAISLPVRLLIYLAGIIILSFGIGIGTVIAMLFTGRVIALMQKPINRLMGTGLKK